MATQNFLIYLQTYFQFYIRKIFGDSRLHTKELKNSLYVHINYIYMIVVNCSQISSFLRGFFYVSKIRSRGHFVNTSIKDTLFLWENKKRYFILCYLNKTIGNLFIFFIQQIEIISYQNVEYGFELWVERPKSHGRMLWKTVS